MIYEEEQNEGRQVNNLNSQVQKPIEEYFSQFYQNRKLPSKYYQSSNQLLREDNLFHHILEETGRETLRITLEMQHKDHKEINKQFQATLMNYYLESYISPLLISHMGLVYKREVFREMKQQAENAMREKQKKYIVLMNIYCQKIIESGQQEEYVNILFEAILKPTPNQNITQLEYCTYYRQRLCALILLQHYYTKKRDTKYQNFYCFWHELFEDNFPILQYIMDDKKLRKKLRMNTGIRVQAVPSLRNYVFQKINTQSDKSDQSSPKIGIEDNLDMEIQDDNQNKQNGSDEKIFKIILDNQKQGKKIEQPLIGKKDKTSKKHKKLTKNQRESIKYLSSRVNNNTGQKFKSQHYQNEKINKASCLNSPASDQQNLKLQLSQQEELNLEKQVVNIIQNKKLESSQKIEQLQMIMDSESNQSNQNSEKELIREFLKKLQWESGNEKQEQDSLDTHHLEYQQKKNVNNKNTKEKGESLLAKLAKQSKPRCSIEQGIKGDKLMEQEDEEEEDKCTTTIKSINQTNSTSSTSQTIPSMLISQFNINHSHQTEKTIGFRGKTSQNIAFEKASSNKDILGMQLESEGSDRVKQKKLKLNQKAKSSQEIQTQGEQIVEFTSTSSRIDAKSFYQVKEDKKSIIDRLKNIAQTNNLNLNANNLQKEDNLNSPYDEKIASSTITTSLRLNQKQQGNSNNNQQRPQQEYQAFINPSYNPNKPIVQKQSEVTTLINSPNLAEQIFLFSDNSIKVQDHIIDDYKKSELATNLTQQNSMDYGNLNNMNNQLLYQQTMQMNLANSLFHSSPLINDSAIGNILVRPQQQISQEKIMLLDRNDNSCQSIKNLCKLEPIQSIISSNSGLSYFTNENTLSGHLLYQQQQQQQQQYNQVVQSSKKGYQDTFIFPQQFNTCQYDSNSKIGNIMIFNNTKAPFESEQDSNNIGLLFNQQNQYLQNSYNNDSKSNNTQQNFSFLKDCIDKQIKGDSQKENRVCYTRQLLPFERAYMPEQSRLIIIQTINETRNTQSEDQSQKKN